MVQFSTATADDVFDTVFAEAKSFGASDAVAVVEELGGERIVRPMPDLEYKEKGVLAWATEIMGVPAHTLKWSLNEGYESHEWDGTEDPIAAMFEAVEQGSDFAVESGTGTGKTFGVALLALWFFVCHEKALVITSAPIEKQLTKLLWKEIGKHWPRFHSYYPNCGSAHLAIYADPTAKDREAWAIIGWACGVEANQESATRAQGFHAENMLLLGEEGPGIPVPILTAFQNTLGEGNNILGIVGNPDELLDSLHQHATTPGVTAIRCSVLDHPNYVLDRSVIPGASGRKAVARRKAKWGEGTSMYDSRVRGLCPAEAVDAIIKLEWVKAAQERWKRATAPGASEADRKIMEGFPAIGFDVAESEAGDLAVIVEGIGALLLSIDAEHCKNATRFGDKVHDRMKAVECRPEHVGGDPIGVGSATFNRLDELTAPTKSFVQRLKNSHRPIGAAQRAPDGSTYDWVPDANEFLNLRAQKYWQYREDLRNGEIALPPDETLATESISVKRKQAPGPIRIEEKADLKKRLGGKSPDRLDAVVDWNWVRRRRTEKVKPKKPDPFTSPRDLNPLPHEDADFDRENDRGMTSMFGGGW